MKKLIIGSLIVLTTLGVSGYTSGNAQVQTKLNVVENESDIIRLKVADAVDTLISHHIGKADLAQID